MFSPRRLTSFMPGASLIWSWNSPALRISYWTSHDWRNLSMLATVRQLTSP